MNKDTLQTLYQVANRFITVYPTIVDDFTDLLNSSTTNELIKNASEADQLKHGLYLIKGLINNFIEKITYE